MGTEQDVQFITHDIRGQICPSSLLFTLREVNREQQALKEDRVRLVIMTDNRNAITTIPEAVSSMGYATSVEKKEGFYEIEIRARMKVPTDAGKTSLTDDKLIHSDLTPD